MKILFAACLAAILFVTGCGSDESLRCRDISIPDTAGLWSGIGTVMDSRFGTGSITLDIAQTNQCVEGDYTMSFTGVISFSDSGRLEGTIDGQGNLAISLISFSTLVCPLSALATVNGFLMEGSYNSGTCAPFRMADFTATRPFTP